MVLKQCISKYITRALYFYYTIKIGRDTYWDDEAFVAVTFVTAFSSTTTIKVAEARDV